ncbi:MAG: hypothetical protein V5A38_07565 [Halolamina sp.]|uniref:DUF7286 family protein n=1 Tax=Halolamina sp. TaxID=1940283 RepID=UPI002FC3ABD8
MNLASDCRARVPFALVGVLLLVTASVYATGLATRADPAVERQAPASLDATERDVRPALRAAVNDAARDAARHPVTDPADTPSGRVLNESSPFVDSLRVRIAVAARAALERVGRNTGDVRTSVSLPAISEPTDLRRAKREVTVSGGDDGEAMTVTVRNISVRAHQDGRVIAERHLSLTLTVRTPVLTLHERATTFEKRLNRGPLEGPGLGRGVTTRLYPVTMARGYARYAGAPIQNVLGTRHVELSTNAALLAQQRAVFGRHDPDGARAVELATVRVGVTDVLGPQHGDAANLASTLLRPTAVDDDSDAESGRFSPQTPAASPIPSSPDAAADEAYLGLRSSLSSVTAGSYRVDATLMTRVLDRSDGNPPAPDPPGDDWLLLTEQSSERTVVSAIGESRAAGNRTHWPTGSGVRATRRVLVSHTTTRVWLHNGETRTTTVQWREEYRVALEVVTAYGPADDAPDGATAPLFRRGGALDGPNLAGSRSRVARSLLAANGGIDAIATRVATGEGDTLNRNESLVAERPDDLEQWVASDLRALRREVAAVSVNVSRRRLAAGEANPAALLAERLQYRRETLIDAPDRYDGVADRARVAARTTYLDRVIAALEQREAATNERNREYRDEVGDGAARRLAKLLRVGTDGTGGAGSHGSGPTQGDEDGEFRVTPDGSPPYLTLSAVDRDHVPTVPPGETVTPLAVETTNWFALPYGDAADGISGALFGNKRVSLQTAAGTLIAANRTAAAGAATAAGDGDGGDDSSASDSARTEREAALATNRAALTEAVRRSVSWVERSVCVAARNGTGLSQRACAGVVRDHRERWRSLGHRGQAMSNGSYADAFTSALVVRGVDRATAEAAGIRVRVHLREVTATRRTSVPAATTNETATAARALAREAVHRRTESGLADVSQRATKRLTGASRLPAGLPLAPPPSTWVATINAWSVSVRGEYQRFTLRTPANGPDGGGGVVRYVRDGSTVRFDVDDDGEPERLGRTERVSFGTETTIVAAVPPGTPGIGDVDGERTEQSPGWPCPGADEVEPCEAVADDGE